MTTPQIIYLSTVAIYVFFFLLFLRLLWWKRYSERNHWSRRPALSVEGLAQMARQNGQELPRFSIMVPARNEADVIEKTIEHMATLDYPKELYEVLVVTDEKEAQASETSRRSLVSSSANFLAKGGPWPSSLVGAGERLILGLLARLAVEESRQHKQSRSGTQEEFSEQPENMAALVRETAYCLAQARGKVGFGRLFYLLRRSFPSLRYGEWVETGPKVLSLAIPVLVAYQRFRPDLDRKLIRRTVVQAAKAHHTLTQEILGSLADQVGHKTVLRVWELRRSGRLRTALDALYREAFPTTQEIVERKIADFAQKPEMPALKHAIVPYDFDGVYRGRCLGRPVPSTKGRALNYALPMVDPRTVLIGFYDAESRPDRRVLAYVAWRRLKDGPRVQILQGPIFQVRNFYQMGALCKVASLYQAVAHDWYLPVLFHRLPFVGGTNVFVDKEMLERIGGYDHTSLTEDLELGTRAYLETGAWPEYLPYPSSEQTPETYRAYYRQRLRWGTGHLQVMDKIRRENRYPEDKRRRLLRNLFVKGQVEWVIYQLGTLVPPTALILYFLGWSDPRIMPYAAGMTLNFFTVFYLAFTFYVFRRYSAHLDNSARPVALAGQVAMVSQLLLLPIAAFFFPIPYSSALLLKWFNRHPTTWVKTPRTRE